MKLAIRQSTFETNSSSVHAFVMLSEDAYEYWKGHGVLMLEDAMDHADEAGTGDGASEEAPLDGADFVVSRAMYDKYQMGLCERDAFTYEDAQALNGKSEYECDSFSEQEAYGGVLLEFDYFA